MKITHCICHEVSFAQIKALSEKLDSNDISALQRILPFGLNCQTCLPYIRRTLATGQTEFNELITDDV